MHSGSCHCGAVAFTVEGTFQQVVECNCSHCQRKGLLLWFVPRAAFSLATGEDRLATYTFNKHVIQHRFCTVCGCQPFSLGRGPDGAEVAAVNVRCLEGIALEDVARVPVDGRAF